MAIATLSLAGGGSYQRKPPFRRDTLRPLGLHHAAGDAPPGEACRRSFGNLGEHVERLGLGKKQAGARRFGGGWLGPWRCTGGRRSRLLRPLRDMALAGKEPAHGGSAQPACQAIDQRLLPASVVALGESGLGRKQRLGRKRCEHHEIDAEADIDGFDPIREKAREMRRLAAGRAEAGVDDGGGAVGAIDRKLKAPRAAAGKIECLAELFRKMIEAGDDAFMGNQRFGEEEPRRVVWCGKKRAARLLAAAKRLIEAMKHGFDRFA
jgi:hypothetical protein